VENQKAADVEFHFCSRRRAVRFISAEPLLGPVNLEELPSASGIGRHLDALSNAGVDKGALIQTNSTGASLAAKAGPARGR